MGYPLVDVRIVILGGKYSSKRTNKMAIEMCTADLMKELFVQAKPILLEPVMKIEISAPKS